MGSVPVMLFVLFLLPTLALAKISISVDMSTRRDLVKISLHGEERKPITSDEARAFGLTDDELKKTCYMHVKDGMYAKYVRKEVYTVRKAVNATVLSLQSKPTVLAHNSLNNSEGIETAQFRADVKQSIANTYTNTWYSSHGIQTGAEVSTEFNIQVQKVGVKASFSYNHQWGESHSVSQAVTVHSSAGTSVPVAPGDSIEATMIASQGTSEIEIHYLTYVYDEVTFTMEKRRLRRSVFPKRINVCVMKSGGLSSLERHDKETIKVEFFTDVDTVLKGTAGNKAKGLKQD